MCVCVCVCVCIYTVVRWIKGCPQSKGGLMMLIPDG